MALLLTYVNTHYCCRRSIFSPTHYPAAALTAQLRTAFDDPAWRTRNRNGVLLGTSATCDEGDANVAVRTLTLTPSLWALYNALPARCTQVS